MTKAVELTQCPLATPRSSGQIFGCNFPSGPNVFFGRNIPFGQNILFGVH